MNLVLIDSPNIELEHDVLNIVVHYTDKKINDKKQKIEEIKYINEIFKMIDNSKYKWYIYSENIKYFDFIDGLIESGIIDFIEREKIMKK